MKYLTFIVTEGEMPADAIATMNREWPAYAQAMDSRGLWRMGRELGLPEEGIATVRVRDGETLVSDGPFLETKEFVGGIELLECADLDAAIAVQSKNPVARFNPFEIRPFKGEPALDQSAAAFGRGEDRGATPHLLITWLKDAPVEGEATLHAELTAWREQAQARGSFVLGGALEDPQAAITLRFTDGEMRISPGPFQTARASIAGIDVVNCADLQQAIDCAASHPLAREHAIDVRPFYVE